MAPQATPGLIPSVCHRLDRVHPADAPCVANVVKKGEKRKKRLNLKKQFKYITVDEKFNDVKYLSSQSITEITDEVRGQYKSKDGFQK